MFLPLLLVLSIVAAPDKLALDLSTMDDLPPELQGRTRADTTRGLIKKHAMLHDLGCGGWRYPPVDPVPKCSRCGDECAAGTAPAGCRCGETNGGECFGNEDCTSGLRHDVGSLFGRRLGDCLWGRKANGDCASFWEVDVGPEICLPDWMTAVCYETIGTKKPMLFNMNFFECGTCACDQSFAWRHMDCVNSLTIGYGGSFVAHSGGRGREHDFEAHKVEKGPSRFPCKNIFCIEFSRCSAVS